jgi:hypothetical protein
MNPILLSALGFAVVMVAAHIFIFWWFVARDRNDAPDTKVGGSEADEGPQT